MLEAVPTVSVISAGRGDAFREFGFREQMRELPLAFRFAHLEFAVGFRALCDRLRRTHKDQLPRCTLPVTATGNNQPATVLYAGVAPSLAEGANQVNIQFPEGIASAR